MPYKAALTKNFLRELKKLPENVKKRVLTAIDELIRNPFSGVRLRGELRKMETESWQVQSRIQD